MLTQFNARGTANTKWLKCFRPFMPGGCTRNCRVMDHPWDAVSNQGKKTAISVTTPCGPAFPFWLWNPISRQPGPNHRELFAGLLRQVSRAGEVVRLNCEFHEIAVGRAQHCFTVREPITLTTDAEVDFPIHQILFAPTDNSVDIGITRDAVVGDHPDIRQTPLTLCVDDPDSEGKMPGRICICHQRRMLPGSMDQP